MITLNTATFLVIDLSKPFAYEFDYYIRKIPQMTTKTKTTPWISIQEPQEWAPPGSPDPNGDDDECEDEYEYEDTASLIWDDDDYSVCICCLWLTRSCIEAMQQADDDMAADVREESHMNAAGRSITHSFRDIRSAARARKYSRKYQSQGPRVRGVGERKAWHAQTRNDNKKQKRTAMKAEIRETQQEKVDWGCGNGMGPLMVVWDFDPTEQFDWDIKEMDDVVRYEKFNWNADVFESPEPYIEIGETFPMWAQRRIAEMRAVKESRIHQKLPRAQQLKAFEEHQLRAMRIKRYNRSQYGIYPGSARTTTLPTNIYDANGHTLLRNAIASIMFDLQSTRYASGNSHFPQIDSNWFDGYTWGWHRNGSGCWVFGYGECEAAIPCLCCTGGYTLPCHCAEFGDGPAPDEQQRCCLIEWVGEEGRRIIVAEDMKGESELSDHRDGDDAEDSEDGWSIVDGCSSVRSCSSVISLE